MLEIFNNIFHYVKKIPKQYYIPLGVGCIGLIFFGYGLWKSMTPKNQENSVLADQTSLISQPIPTVKTPLSEVKTVKKLAVDIEGGIEKPGVYHLDPENIVQDALIAAGGLSVNANRNWVEKHVNLAAKITDGSKIYIPRIGENSSLASPDENTNLPNIPNIPNTPQKQSGKSHQQKTQESATLTTDILGTDTSSLININSATVDELHGIPGIGKKTAEKIINNRPYNDIQDLLTRKIVRKSTFEKIKDRIAAY